MAGEPERIYWDSCCFTYYINRDPERQPVLSAILDQAHRSDGKLLIFTSVLSKIETAFAAEERAKRVLDPEEEARINNLWADVSVIKMVEIYEAIADQARQYMRSAMLVGRGLRAPDAIHFATARRMGITVFHTYDEKLWNPAYQTMTGLNISKPHADQLPLEGFEASR